MKKQKRTDVRDMKHQIPGDYIDCTTRGRRTKGREQMTDPNMNHGKKCFSNHSLSFMTLFISTAADEKRARRFIQLSAVVCLCKQSNQVEFNLN